MIYSIISFDIYHIFRFENIYNARVAYQAYEAGDMKGMLLTEHALMRTLKVSVHSCFIRLEVKKGIIPL